MIAKLSKFFSEMIVELKKVSWTTKQELIDSTWIVFISSAFLAVFIWVTDMVLSKFISLIIK
ncbi:MAG TPA: preprotein translocase subunit SecE [Candidatus Omnitrophota bacterium]|nr:preprotein translocase subunit SecE [Candidatus Omnitrophota bacterium]HPB67418.1 preprotein translocase subunit SecE [Candidatus Omnitrophota bacterium]HQO57455.1 preprotein translocase subunit SecE [Candidatus Omnitrophota bacterium]